MKPWEYIDAMTIYKKELDMSDSNISNEYFPYRINRWLSSIDILIPIVNEINQYTKSFTKQQHYNFLLAVLPQQKIRIDYKAVKINKDLSFDERRYIASYFEVGLREAELYINMLTEDEIKKILETFKYGINQMIEV